jgi:hypothetical protein
MSSAKEAFRTLLEHECCIERDTWVIYCVHSQPGGVQIMRDEVCGKDEGFFFPQGALDEAIDKFLELTEGSNEWVGENEERERPNLVREALAAREQAEKEMSGYEEGKYRAAPRDYAKGRWAAASDLIIAMNRAKRDG